MIKIQIAGVRFPLAAVALVAAVLGFTANPARAEQTSTASPVDEFSKQLEEFQKSVPGTSAQDVMNLVLMTQYFDTLKEIGATSATNTILIPHSPGNLTDLSTQLRNAMMTADLATKDHGSFAPDRDNRGPAGR